MSACDERELPARTPPRLRPSRVCQVRRLGAEVEFVFLLGAFQVQDPRGGGELQVDSIRQSPKSMMIS